MDEFSIGLGLKNARNESGYTVREVSDFLISKGIKASPNTIYSWENSHSQPSPDALLLLCKKYGIENPGEYFQNRTSSPVSAQAPDSFIQPPHYTDLCAEYRAVIDGTCNSLYNAQQVMVKQATIDWRMRIDELSAYRKLRKSLQPVSAGHGVYLGPEEFEDVKVVANAQTHNASFCIAVEGNSMEPKFHNGDILLVDTAIEVEVGDIGIFTLDGYGYVKKRGQNDLISLNPDYAPIPLNDSIRCNGKVVGVLDPEYLVGS